MTATSNFIVRFDGHATRSGPLCWGQRWVWDTLVDLGPGDVRLTMRKLVAVPEGRTIKHIQAVLRDLIGQHEGLRTRFGLGADGEPVQHVFGAGEVTVRVSEVAGAPVDEVAARLVADLAADRFDLAREWPLRLGVVTAAGTPRMVVMALAQMGFDGWSRLALARELAAGLAVSPGRAATTDGSDIRQPLDQAAFERSPRGLAISAAAVDFWREQHRRAVTVPPPRWRPRGDRPRFWRADFRSPVLARACAVLSERLRVLPAAVLLSGLGTLLGHRLGQPVCVPQVVFNNRFAAATRRTMCHLAQAVPIVLNVADGSFTDLVQRTSRAMLRATRFGGFDPVVVGAMMHGPGPHRGTHHGYPVVFNFDSRPDAEAMVRARSRPERAAASELGSQLRWVEQVEEENLGCYINVYDMDEAHIMLWIDTSYLSKVDLAAVVFGVERLLVAAGEDDVGLHDICAVTDVPPAAHLPAMSANRPDATEEES